jgi:hypothetical protein
VDSLEALLQGKVSFQDSFDLLHHPIHPPSPLEGSSVVLLLLSPLVLSVHPPTPAQEYLVSIPIHLQVCSVNLLLQHQATAPSDNNQNPRLRVCLVHRLLSLRLVVCLDNRLSQASSSLFGGSAAAISGSSFFGQPSKPVSTRLFDQVSAPALACSLFGEPSKPSVGFFDQPLASLTGQQPGGFDPQAVPRPPPPSISPFRKQPAPTGTSMFDRFKATASNKSADAQPTPHPGYNPFRGAPTGIPAVTAHVHTGDESSSFGSLRPKVSGFRVPPTPSNAQDEKPGSGHLNDSSQPDPVGVPRDIPPATGHNPFTKTCSIDNTPPLDKMHDDKLEFEKNRV